VALAGADGQRPGGAYTYDWIENLFGLGMHSAGEILPQFQDLKQGDELPLGPGRPIMRVEVFQPERALTLRLENHNWVWTFALFPEDGRTRLLSRNRIAVPHASPLTRLFNLLVMEPGSLVMERKMLLGIRERAQRLAAGYPYAAGCVRHPRRPGDMTSGRPAAR
jgi:hypothetical protein